MKEKIKKIVVGYGVVGTWLNKPNHLGGSLPKWLASNRAEAKREAIDNKRLYEFCEEEGSEQWLCEITIKPIQRLRVEKTYKDLPSECLSISTYPPTQLTMR